MNPNYMVSKVDTTSWVIIVRYTAVVIVYDTCVLINGM